MNKITRYIPVGLLVCLITYTSMPLALSEFGDSPKLVEGSDGYRKTLTAESPFPQNEWNLKQQTAYFIDHTPVLFLDDQFVLGSDNIERSLHPLVKQSRPVSFNLPEKYYKWVRIQSIVTALEDGLFYVYCTSKYNEKNLFIVFSTRNGTDFTPLKIDRVPPEKIWDDLPKDDLPEHNNVLIFDENYGYDFPIYYVRFFRTVNDTEYPFGAVMIHKYPRPRKIAILRSSDGLEWERLPNQIESVIDYESNSPTYDSFHDRYLSYLRLWDPPGKPVTGHWRKIGMIEASRSGGKLAWSGPRLVLSANEDDGPGTDIYYMEVFGYAGKYLGIPMMYYRTASIDRSLKGRFAGELAFSHDGNNWQRVQQGSPVLTGGQYDDWDSGLVGISSNPVIIDDRLFFYYWGRNRTHDEPLEGMVIQTGVAASRLDGFVSLDAGDEEGIVVTVPFFPQGKHLYINADARGGYIRVEVLQSYGYQEQLSYFYPRDPDGPARKGLFTVEKCIPFFGDSVAHHVEWANDENFVDDFPEDWNIPSDTEDFNHRSIALKFYMKNASLYSFWFADDRGTLEKGRLEP